MLTDQKQVSTLVIGAGLSGLAAARRLADAGDDVLVVDKSRGVGGRCSTRRFNSCQYDHGAQFFTVRDGHFATLVEGWQRNGLVDVWSHGFPYDGRNRDTDGHPRYVAVGGMNRLPKLLGDGLSIVTGAKVARVERIDAIWTIHFENRMPLQAERLVLTAPLPQSFALLPEVIRGDAIEACPALAHVRYEPCLAVLLQLDGEAALPAPGGMHVDDPVIAWIADNTSKGLKAATAAITVHTTRTFSETEFDATPETIAQAVIARGKRWFNGQVTDWQVHRWRYSKPVTFVGRPCVAVGDPVDLVFCGDCMLPPSRIEGAVLSGWAAADALSEVQPVEVTAMKEGTP
jgi:predicted NAD/FAD-dependent oxidoreductase